ncbi:hypothetical protein GCM10023321_73360 [Pseudonocardia eucalypti]|uniref:Uncharacterized protein n=1 Tax=Pseudonocardia eucalypti TaxID=648755 RepID=A0ABP9R8X6_9PSEU
MAGNHDDGRREHDHGDQQGAGQRPLEHAEVAQVVPHLAERVPESLPDRRRAGVVAGFRRVGSGRVGRGRVLVA